MGSVAFVREDASPNEVSLRRQRILLRRGACQPNSSQVGNDTDTVATYWGLDFVCGYRGGTFCGLA